MISDYITSEVTLDPNSQPAPRGLTAHVSISSGSLHIRSQNGPSCGISQLRSITLICQVTCKKHILHHHPRGEKKEIADYIRSPNIIKETKTFCCSLSPSSILHHPSSTHLPQDDDDDNKRSVLSR